MSCGIQLPLCDTQKNERESVRSVRIFASLLLFFYQRKPMVTQKLQQDTNCLYSGWSSSTKPSCSRTELNCCTNRNWNPLQQKRRRSNIPAWSTPPIVYSNNYNYNNLLLLFPKNTAIEHSRWLSAAMMSADDDFIAVTSCCCCWCVWMRCWGVMTDASRLTGACWLA